MAHQRVPLIAADGARDEQRADEADERFRERLEGSLDRAYRLATIIVSDEQDAEDLTHDAVERAWRARASLRDLDRFEAWFHRIVVNACRDRLRRRRSGPVTISVEASEHQPARDVAARATPDLPAAAARRDALVQALRTLSEDQQIVVVLRFYLDLEIDEIARRLGARPNTVKSHLHRALGRMRVAWEAADAREVLVDER